jgi:hypothetical protein
MMTADSPTRGVVDDLLQLERPGTTQEVAESDTQQLERILSDILTNDAEIKGGAKAAGLDPENLQEIVLRQKDEVLAECRAE